MSAAKLAVVCSLAAVALSACGAVQVQPAATTSGRAASRGRIDDPRTNNPDRIKCLRDQHLTVREIGTTGLQIGVAPSGPRVQFAPSQGTAEGDQIRGQAQAAEVIGAALLYPDAASDRELTKIENCLAQGVNG